MTPAATPVTVVMAAYQAMPYLPEAVDSILGQSLADWRMIIVDDGSTDGTADYLDSLDDPRITVIHQDNAGQQAAAARGITLATTRYIARMDADDVAFPNRLARQVAFLDDHPEVGLVGAQIQRMGPSGNLQLPSAFPTDHETIYAQLADNQHAMVNPVVTFRRDLFEAIGGYWEHDIAEDWDMFLRIGEVSELANLDEPLLGYRFHPTSINGRRMREAQLHNDYAAHLAHLRSEGRPEIPLDEFRRRHRSSRIPGRWLFALDCYSIGQYRIAIAELSDGATWRGRMRLVYAALCSPQRTAERVVRLVRKRLSG